jgi:hypothetical protein
VLQHACRVLCPDEERAYRSANRAGNSLFLDTLRQLPILLHVSQTEQHRLRARAKQPARHSFAKPSIRIRNVGAPTSRKHRDHRYGFVFTISCTTDTQVSVERRERRTGCRQDRRSNRANLDAHTSSDARAKSKDKQGRKSMRRSIVALSSGQR